MNEFSAKLSAALDSNDPSAVHNATQEIMQSMANDFSALAEKYGSVFTRPHFPQHGRCVKWRKP